MKAVEGERLLDKFLTNSDETAVAAFRVLLIPRPDMSNLTSKPGDKLRAVDAHLPDIGGLAAQNNIQSKWQKNVIAQMHIETFFRSGSQSGSIIR